ncbi:MAG: DNA double-strand break repair nuclease NurA [Candidatus Thorarchaeota archaeon]|nr:DNA double-strand break repair nuclease NurA [Candidatus Thorarchaeota archaeon]
MDKRLDHALSKLAEEIDRVETTRKRFGAVMKKIKGHIDLSRFPAIVTDTMETSLLTKLEPTSLSGLRIAGIDGGLVRKRFRSMDILLTRAVAVVFQFGCEDGPDVEFHPEAFPEPKVTPVLLALPSPELDQLASLERVATELEATISVLDEFHTDLILVDGSLFYHPKDRPQRGSTAFTKFQEVMALYRQLYHKSRRKKTTLVGIVKDSRSTRMVQVLGEILPHIIRDSSIFELMQDVDYRWLLKVSRDCDLLDTFLEPGERTYAFRYSSELTHNENSVSDELTIWSSSIWVTYLKTAQDDLPLRIEVLMDQDSKDTKELDRALSAILPLSWQHPEYGIPTPILEADARARITGHEAQLIIDRLMALSGLTYTVLEKRRSRNPFGGG